MGEVPTTRRDSSHASSSPLRTSSVVVGPDGLVANVAKYAGDQAVIINSVLSRMPACSLQCTPGQGREASFVSTREPACGRWTS